MKNNLLSKILIAPNVISSDGVDFIINHDKKQDVQNVVIYPETDLTLETK